MPTIGRADIDVHYDGKGLPREAKELGEETGAAAGEAHADAFDEEVEKGFKETQDDLVKDARKGGIAAGKESGEGFGRSFHESMQNSVRTDLDDLADKIAAVFKDPKGLDDYAENLKGVDGEYNRIAASGAQVRNSLRDLRDTGQMTNDEFERLVGITRTWESAAGDGAKTAEKNRYATDKLKDSYFDLEREVGKSRDSLKEKIDLNFEEAMGKLDRFKDDLGDAKDSGGDLRHEMTELGGQFEKTGVKKDDFRENVKGLGGDLKDAKGHTEKAGDALKEFGEKAKNVKVGKVGKDIKDAGDKAGDAAPNVSKLSGAFRGLSQFDPADNMGQLFALIVALAPQVASLAAAAGGGLLILAGGIGALALGLGGGFLGFSNLFGDLKDVQPTVRPAAQALQDFAGKDGLALLRDALQEKMFTGLAGEFDKLRTQTIPSLTPAFATLGGAINGVLSKWTTDLQSSGFKQDFTALITSLSPSVTSLGSLFGSLTGIVGKVLTDIAPYTKRFIDSVEDSAKGFLTFLNTPAGNRKVQNFFDDVEGMIGTLKDSLGKITTAFGKLITPANMKNTTDAIDDLSEAIADLVTASGDINGAVPIVTEAVRQIASKLGEVVKYGKDQDTKAFGKNWVDNLASGIQAGYLEVDHALDLIIVGFGAFFRDLGEFVGSQVGAIGTLLNDLATPAKWGNVPGDLEKLRSSFASGFAKIGGDLDIVGGNLVKFFDALPAKTKASLTKMSTNFGLTGEDAKKFGGQIYSMAGSAGVDLDKLDGKNLNGVIKMLGLTGQNAETFRAQWTSKMDASGVSVDKLDAGSKKALDRVSTNMGDTGKKSQAFQQVVSKAADDAGVDLTTLSQTRSLGELERKLGIAGTASKTDFANKIIAAAGDSGESIDKLPPKIGDLVRKYGTIPKNVNTDVELSGSAAAISQAGAVRAALDSLHDKRINITQVVSQIGDPGKGGHAAVGGIMAGGKLIAGGTAAAFAAGGILSSPQIFGNVLAGEAGAEAIVPLTGPLARVDASVRQLSAYARGKTLSGGSSGTSVGRQVTVSPGAVQVITNNANAGQVASAVLDRLVPSL